MSRSISVPNAFIIKTMELVNGIDRIFLSEIRKKKNGRKWLGVDIQPKASFLLFHWAIHETTRQYEACL